MDAKSQEATARSDNAEIIVPSDQARQLVKERTVYGMVTFSEIHLASDDNIKSLTTFENPRKKEGLDDASIEELSRSIAQDGLLQNVVIREIADPADETKVYKVIVAGERRTRAIRYLLATKAKCYNPANGKLEPARKVYKKIPARSLERCSDLQALAVAFLENDQHIALAQASIIDTCTYLEDVEKIDRKDICRMLNKSAGWLSITRSFESRLIPQLYSDLRLGKIPRSVAAKYMEFTVESQEAVAGAARQIAESRRKAKVAHAEQEAETATKNKREAEAEARILAGSTFADDDEVRSAKNRARRAGTAVTRAKERVTQVATTPVGESQSDISEGAHKLGLMSEGGRPLTGEQIQTHFVDKVATILGGTEDIVDDVTGNLIPRHDIDLVSHAAVAIGRGTRDIGGIIRDFYNSRGWPDNLVRATGDVHDVVDDLDGKDPEDDDDVDDLDGIDLDTDDENTPSVTDVAGIDLADVGNDDEVQAAA
jgi:ParB-like chromosome segregation protein Spo0J